jgi:hypothetical protein
MSDYGMLGRFRIHHIYFLYVIGKREVINMHLTSYVQ